jgi:hypothetical protein
MALLSFTPTQLPADTLPNGNVLHSRHDQPGSGIPADGADRHSRTHELAVFANDDGDGASNVGYLGLSSNTETNTRVLFNATTVL